MDHSEDAQKVTCRTLTAAIFIVSVLASLKLLDPYYLIFEKAKVVPGFQIWRLATSFLLTGGFGIIFVPYTGTILYLVLETHV